MLLNVKIQCNGLEKKYWTNQISSTQVDLPVLPNFNEI